MSEENKKIEQMSDETFTIILAEEYPEDKEYRELHLTFSTSFLTSPLYKENGSPKIPKDKIKPIEIQELAEKCGILLYLHNSFGPAVERFIWVDGVKLMGKSEKYRHPYWANMWINGVQIKFDEFREIDYNGTKQYEFINNEHTLSKEALKILHNKKMQNSIDKVIGE